MTERKMAVVGAGLIGRAWAIVFARAGWTVQVFDPSMDQLEGLQAAMAEDAALLARHGLRADGIADRVVAMPELGAALAGVELVQENGPETLEAKQAIFADLDALAPPEALLVSSTSALMPSLFTEALAGRARCLVGHPVNPPHLVPLVELCGAEWTAPEALARAAEIYGAVGQVPIRVKREIDGFVLNRLQGALLAEAMRLLRDDVVSVEDLDKTVRDGLGLWWSFMGPMETIELNAPGGAADYFERYCRLYRDLADAPPGRAVFGPEAVAAVLSRWPDKLTPEEIPSATQWRNERLAALAAHKAKSGKPDL